MARNARRAVGTVVVAGLVGTTLAVSACSNSDDSADDPPHEVEVVAIDLPSTLTLVGVEASTIDNVPNGLPATNVNVRMKAKHDEDDPTCVSLGLLLDETEQPKPLLTRSRTDPSKLTDEVCYATMAEGVSRGRTHHVFLTEEIIAALKANGSESAHGLFIVSAYPEGNPSDAEEWAIPVSYSPSPFEDPSIPSDDLSSESREAGDGSLLGNGFAPLLPNVAYIFPANPEHRSWKNGTSLLGDGIATTVHYQADLSYATTVGPPKVPNAAVIRAQASLDANMFGTTTEIANLEASAGLEAQDVGSSGIFARLTMTGGVVLYEYHETVADKVGLTWSETGPFDTLLNKSFNLGGTISTIIGHIELDAKAKGLIGFEPSITLHADFDIPSVVEVEPVADVDMTLNVGAGVDILGIKASFDSKGTITLAGIASGGHLGGIIKVDTTTPDVTLSLGLNAVIGALYLSDISLTASAWTIHDQLIGPINWSAEAWHINSAVDYKLEYSATGQTIVKPSFSTWQ